MLTRKFLKNNSIGYSIVLISLLLVGISFVHGQEKHKLIKEYAFRENSYSDLFINEIARIRDKSSELKFVAINYSQSRNLIKLLVMNELDFSEILNLFHEEVNGIIFEKGLTIVVFGDSRSFLKDTFNYVKTDKYLNYYKNSKRKITEKYKKKGLIEFPGVKDPLSYFYCFKDKKLEFIKKDMVLVVGDNWQ